MRAHRHRLNFLLNGGSEDRLSAADRFSVIRAIPRTGRTHQIRVHLASIGHPIVGDKIYGPDEQLYLRFIETGWTHELEQKLLLPRHALHSAKLAIEDHREWTSALPPDLAEFCSGDLDMSIPHKQRRS